MAKKISQLTQATEVKSDDVTVIVQDGETKKLPLNMMVTKQDIENKKIAGLAKLDEIEATYENDTYTPTITVKNKSSVKTGEGDGVDYSANVMDGHAKSAILKGQTLVNLVNDIKIGNANVNTGRPTSLNTGFTTNLSISGSNELTIFLKNITPDVARYIILEFDSNDVKISTMSWSYLDDEFINYTTKSNCARLTLSVVNDDKTITTQTIDEIKETYKPMVLSGNHSYIPYFEGMQSVKMPVLTTVGKNLLWNLNPNNPDNNFSSSGGGTSPVLYSEEEQAFYTNRHRAINLTAKPNTTYTFSAKCKNRSEGTKGYVWLLKSPYALGIGEKTDNWERFSGTFTTNSTGNISLYIYDSVYFKDIQLEESPIVTSYEPFKTNILTVNEDVTLRGIGDVRDELNCLTGEVTERISEIVADGVNFKFVKVSQNMQQYGDGSVRFDLQELNDINTKVSNNWVDASKIIINDRLKTGLFPTFANTKEKDVITMWNKTLVIVFSDTNIRTLEQANDWLKQNPITIQYQLANESIKTVDLMPSGTHPSTTPYCWKNGHIQLSSSGLLPNLEYSVVTSRAGQINQNATMIVKNDKRIFDLEILLAGGLVNTTYQALTLQNQVETGLSNVSLSSETEPDYLLYHMIMKLIEEKAYKLDDLTEKVSVFYLYEKLSDEQFETIYSALYPFVEDEIVEESVVEELPEVVEDEVIM